MSQTICLNIQNQIFSETSLPKKYKKKDLSKDDNAENGYQKILTNKFAEICSS